MTTLDATADLAAGRRPRRGPAHRRRTGTASCAGSPCTASRSPSALMFLAAARLRRCSPR